MIAYTDGACFPNPGQGGWGWVLTKDEKFVESDSGAQANVTNNRMEYLALIKVVEKHGKCLTKVCTDSMLLVNTCTTWRHGWKNRGWKKKGGEIKNLDLVKRIDELLSSNQQITVQWVKGHAGDPFNEMADELANSAAGIEKGYFE